MTGAARARLVLLVAVPLVAVLGAGIVTPTTAAAGPPPVASASTGRSVVPAVPAPGWRSAVPARVPAQPAPLLAEGSGSAVPGHYIVGLAAAPATAGPAATAASRSRAGVTARVRAAGGVVDGEYRRALNGFTARLTPRQLAVVRADPEVAFVAPDRVIHYGRPGPAAALPLPSPRPGPVTAAVTQTPLSIARWGLDRIDQRNRPVDDRYTYPFTGAGVSAYVFSTGIRSTHVELAGRVAPGYTAFQDGRGTQDCPLINGGTHLAGIVGGRTTGVAKDVRLVAMRVMNCSTTGTEAAFLAAMDWMMIAHFGPTVAVFPFSTYTTPYPVIEDSVNRAIDAGITVVAMAANWGGDACLAVPGNMPRVITVSATGFDDLRQPWANYGSCVDLFAPGEGLSPGGTDDTELTSTYGTEIATGYVAGAAAQYLEAVRGASPAQVQAGLLRAATPGVVREPGALSPNRLLFVASPLVAPRATLPDRLLPGQALYPGDRLCSPNTLYCLEQQASDGALVLSKPGRRVLWTSGARGYVTVMQGDGNLVSYDGVGMPVWASNSVTQALSSFFVQDDGNLVVYLDSNRAVAWASNTAQGLEPPPQPGGRTDRLRSGQAIYRDRQFLVSANGVYTLSLDRDTGILAIRHGGVGIWATAAFDDDWLEVGTLPRIYLRRSNGVSVWSRGLGGRVLRAAPTTLVMQDDGDLVLTRDSDGVVLWESGTTGL